MAIKAIINNTEKEIEQIKNSDEQDVDYVYSRIGDTEVEGEPPISIKSIGGELADYRIYGQTSRNLFDGELYIGYYRASDGQLITDPSANNFYKYVRSNLIPCMPQTTYTLKYVCTYTNKFVIFTWYSGNNFITSTNFTNIDAHTLIVTAPLSATKFGITISGIDNDPSTQTTIAPSDISNIMLNSGSTPLPYEPYGESVGDRTGNLCENSISGVNVSSNGFIYADIYNDVGYAKVVAGETYTINSYVYAFFEEEPKEGDRSYDNGRVVGTSPSTFEAPINGYVAFRTESGSQLQCNEGNNLLPYEPYGYKVPVTVEGKNILPMSTTPISMEVDDFYCEYDGAGTITLTTDKDNAVLGGFSIPLSEEFIIPVSVGQGGDGCVQFNNSIANSVNTDTDHLRVNFWYNTTFIDDWGLTAINRINSTYSAMARKTINRVSIDINGTGFSTNRKIVIRPAFVLNTTEQVPFEPYHAPVTTPIYLTEQIRKVGDEAEYISYADQKLHRVGADDLDVTLPALSTIKGTNTLSVNTSIQPSNMYIKDNFDYKKVFTATRTIEGESPLNYKSIEDSDSTLSNYRIYGQTVDGESVGDRTGNLFDIKTFAETCFKYSATVNYTNNTLTFTATGMDAYVNAALSTGVVVPLHYRSSCIDVLPSTTYTISMSSAPKCFISWVDSSFNVVSNFESIPTNATSYTFTTPKDCTKLFIRFGKYVTNIGDTFTISDIMLNSGLTALPYEPYGYKVPVTVSNGTDTLTTPIYLPEQIRKVGDEAEYVDYATQKQHRVRKNLLPNTATSQTINGVTFTVNGDGSVTCNGTANVSAPSIIYIPFTLPIKLYELSGCPDSGSANTYRVDIRNIDSSMYKYNGNNVVDNGTGCLFDGGNKQYCIRIASGYTCNNLTFYPMIRKADITDDTYEPYIENTDLDVTLPALPTVTGTNTLSVETEI